MPPRRGLMVGRFRLQDELGRGAQASSLPLAPEELVRRGVAVAEVERGGDVTYHGPGQRIGYVLLDLNRRARNVRVVRAVSCPRASLQKVPSRRNTAPHTRQE